MVELSKNDSLPLDYASQLCNSDILSRCTHFIAFAFHDSDVMYVLSGQFLGCFCAVCDMCALFFADAVGGLVWAARCLKRRSPPWCRRLVLSIRV